MPDTTARLSVILDNDDQHARPTDKVRWTRATGTAPCDECVALQHETRGEHRRKPARHRRTIPGGPAALSLCSLHAEAWRARDDYHGHR